MTPESRRGTEPARLFDLSGRVVLLTGAAGKLADQMLRALTAAGASVALADQNERDCAERAALLRREGTDAEAFGVDIRDEASVAALVAAVHERWGRIDVLVNAAGRTFFQVLEELTLDQWREVLESNLTSVFLTTRAVVPYMRRASRGSIVNIGSIYGVVGADQRIYGTSGINSSPAYAAAKGGVINLTRHLAVHLAPAGIRANSISPGGFFANQDPEFVRGYVYRTPLGCLGNETDLMGAILFLASDASAYVTGHNLIVDGGWTAW